MSKNVRVFMLAFLLLAVIAVNVSAAAVAEPTGLPCYDMWQNCLSGGGSAEYCEGVWCGCMQALYGYICGAAVA